jgi:hypothetical protein
LTHPVVDADGHWLEFGPVVGEQLRKIGGSAAADGFASVRGGVREALMMSVEERQRRRISQEGFWGSPERNTRDRATGLLPRLLYERLDELGLDFAVLYPTTGLRVPRITDDTQRRAACRAFNVYTADCFREFADRMTPAAIIPVHTPDEAIEELEHAAAASRFAMFAQPRAAPRGGGPRRFPRWRDSPPVRPALGLDSARLRQALGQVRRAAHRADLPYGLQTAGAAPVADQLHLQPHRALRRRRPRGLQGALPRRSDAALSDPELRLPRGRGRLGGHALRRSDRPLGQAQPQGARAH